MGDGMNGAPDSPAGSSTRLRESRSAVLRYEVGESRYGAHPNTALSRVASLSGFLSLFPDGR